MFQAIFAGALLLAAGQSSSQVRIVTPEQRVKCEYLGLIEARKAIGTNKQAGALKKAMERVAKLGGNSLFIVTSNSNLFDGATLSGEALRCP